MIGAEVSRLLLALGALAAVGCAAPAPQVRQPFRPYQLAPQRSAGQRPATATRTAGREAVSLDTTAAAAPGIRIDSELVRFAVAQRESRLRVRSGAEMPDDVRERWAGLLADVDRFLGQRPAQTVPLDVIRARVALDAELDLDNGHYGLLPAGLPASIKARVVALDTRLGQVRRLAQPAKAVASALAWPLVPVVVTSLFGDRTDPFSGEDRFHQGIDLKARVGQLVQAAADGVVTRAGWAGGHGLHAELSHDDGTVTRYSHLSTVLVSTGMRVPAGAPLGLAGSTGRSTGPHLHFEIWREGRPLDPLSELVDPALQDLGYAVGDGD